MVFKNFKNMIFPILFILAAACGSSDAPAKIADAQKNETPAPAAESAKTEISASEKIEVTAAEPTHPIEKPIEKQQQPKNLKEKLADAPVSNQIETQKKEEEKPVTDPKPAETERQSEQKIFVPEVIAPPQPAPTIHETWDELLQKFVNSAGIVNYKGLKKEEARLDAYLQKLSENVPTAANSRNEKMAFWINAYNAATVKLILENLPISSITKLDGGKTWDVKRIQLGSKKYSLNEIENEILRPQFKDARIHFAVNCAAKSCPPLLNGAFFPEKLEQQLERQTRKFIQNSVANSISESAVEVSKIFEWYASDFGDLKTFLNRYSTVKISNSISVKFKDYDWALND